jgi:hypothetical protein
MAEKHFGGQRQPLEAPANTADCKDGAINLSLEGWGAGCRGGDKKAAQAGFPIDPPDHGLTAKIKPPNFNLATGQPLYSHSLRIGSALDGRYSSDPDLSLPGPFGSRMHPMFKEDLQSPWMLPSIAASRDKDTAGGVLLKWKF